MFVYFLGSLSFMFSTFPQLINNLHTTDLSFPLFDCISLILGPYFIK